jgi:hypothetical protein
MVSGNIAVTIQTYRINLDKVSKKIEEIKLGGELAISKIQDLINMFDEIQSHAYDIASIDNEKELQLQSDISNLETILGKLITIQNEIDPDIDDKIFKINISIGRGKDQLRDVNLLSSFDNKIVAKSDKLMRTIEDIESNVSISRGTISNATKIDNYYNQIRGIENEIQELTSEAQKIKEDNRIIPDVSIRLDSDVPILNSVSDASNEFVGSLSRNNNIIKNTIFSSFDYEEYDLSKNLINSSNNELARLKDDIAKLEMEDGFGNPRFNQSAHYFKIDKLRKLISKKEDDIRTLQNKTTGNVNISIKSISSYTDLNLVAVRKLQSDIREALKIFNNDKEIKLKTKEWKIAIRNQIFDIIKKAFISTEFRNFLNDIENYITNVRNKTRDNKTINTLNSIKVLLSDNYIQISSQQNIIISDIRKAIKIKDDRTKFESKAVIMIYMLKSLRVAVAWLAFYLADTLFKDYYIKQKYGKKETIVDLRWYVVIYASFQFIFDIIALIVMYFVRRIDPEVVSGALMLDYAFDAFIVTLMVLASSIWVADIIQDKRYFMYKTSTTRATRVLKTIMFWLLVIHSITPYYYLTGPNFTGSANAKDFDEKIKKKVTVVEGEEKSA